MNQAVDRSVWQGRVDALEGELGALASAHRVGG